MTALTRRVRRSELETPCALRLGEPNQNGVTSDALCRATSLTQELLSRLRQDTRVFHLETKPACALRRARTLHVAACLRLPRFALRAPSVGLMSILAPCVAARTNRARLRSLLCFRFRAQHPFENHAPALRVEENRRASLPNAALVRLTAHLGFAGKMPLTDFCNRPSIRALVVRPTPELMALTTMTASMKNPGAFKPAPSRLRRPDRLATI